MIQYHFNRDLQILEVTYEGEISADDIIKHSLYIANNKELPRTLNILTDSTKARHTFSLSIIKELLQYVEKSLQNYDYIKDAFIHSKPVETAYSHIFEKEKKHINYSHRIFSTRKAALNWLNN